MILFYDTETTGKADFNADHTAPHQPRIIQLAALLCDNTGRELASLNTLIEPDGWLIDPGAEAVHGISLEDCKRSGIPIVSALSVFNGMLIKAFCASGHNEKFDRMLVMSELHRMAKPHRFDGKDTFCTMQRTTDICRLPGRRFGQFKWPKLEEAFRHFFPDREMDSAHDAMSDVRACRDIYFALNSIPSTEPCAS